MLLLGDVLLPTEASADVLSRLQDYAGLIGSSEDSKTMAIIAFLYVFCCIAPISG